MLRYYLIEQYQFINVNGDISVHATSQFGIPQGSILGPLFPPKKGTYGYNYS